MKFDEGVQLVNNLKIRFQVEDLLIVTLEPSKSATTNLSHMNNDILFQDSETLFIFRVLPSKGESISNSSLKSLIHRLVYESKDSSSSKRCIFLHEELNRMLPNHNHAVTVFDKASKARKPYSSGPNKGEVYFDDRNFGSPVHIILA